MKYLVKGSVMQLLDRYTSEHFHVPSLVLMEQAAGIFVQKLLYFYPDCKNILVVCGLGNNGADGLAIARLLNQKGKKAVVYDMQNAFPEKKGSELFELQKDILLQYGYPFTDNMQKEEYDLLVDALFGIGLSRDITGSYREVILQMKGLGLPIIAVDIASGIDADSGRVCGVAVKADYTISFSFGKMGQYLWPGNEYSGHVCIAPIGITEAGEHGQAIVSSLEKEDLKRLLPARRAHSNKGSYGKVLIIAGSPGMSGAAFFAAKAAYRTGAGLVRILTHESNRLILQQLIPEAVLSVYEDGCQASFLQQQIDWCDSIVIGPGLGMGEMAAEIVRQVMEEESKPVIADADALNILASHQDWLDSHRCPLVITPHLGEMGRLTGRKVSEIQTSLQDTAESFAAEKKLVCLLKDFRTMITSGPGRLYLNLSGNHGMATGGSGDVLSGILGTLLAQKENLLTAAALAAYIHGAAGDEMAGKLGCRSLMAGDLIEGISLCLRDF